LHHEIGVINKAVHSSGLIPGLQAMQCRRPVYSNTEEMAYNELLADRIRQVFETKKILFEEKKMMGGVCYLVNEKMCAGIIKENLMVRIDPGFHEKALSIHGCREMDFTGRPMKGFVFVDPVGIDMDDQLEYWIGKAMEFNPIARSSKKPKRNKAL
jgi:hypothetical protein